jgi:translation initiation factor 3 subunit G
MASVDILSKSRWAEASRASAASGAGRESKQWGDEETNPEEDGAVPVDTLISRSESQPDANGVKTVIEVYLNAKGQKIQVTKKVKVTRRVVRTSKGVAERRKWKKFGDVKGVGSGPEENVTYPSRETIKLDLGGQKEAPVESVKIKVVCSNCGEPGHWSLKCPKRNEIALKKGSTTPEPSPRAEEPLGGGVKKKYLPPSLRHGAAGAAAEGSRFRTDENQQNTVRITNLSEDTTESDLAELVRSFGRTTRIFLAKDKHTNASRGFAFVTFLQYEDAAASIAKLNGYGYANLILHAEWAKPREDK